MIQDSYMIYLAGPFFNQEQKDKMDLVKNMLIDIGYTVADPRELGPVIVDTAAEAKTPEFFAKIFEGNVQGMLRSSILLACLDDKDIGTAFELGFAYARSKQIVSFAFSGNKTNVMLGQAVDAHCTTFEGLEALMRANYDSIKLHGSFLTTEKNDKAASDE